MRVDHAQLAFHDAPAGCDGVVSHHLNFDRDAHGGFQLVEAPAQLIGVLRVHLNRQVAVATNRLQGFANNAHDRGRIGPELFADDLFGDPQGQSDKILFVLFTEFVRIGAGSSQNSVPLSHALGAAFLARRLLDGFALALGFLADLLGFAACRVHDLAGLNGGRIDLLFDHFGAAPRPGRNHASLDDLFVHVLPARARKANVQPRAEPHRGSRPSAAWPPSAKRPARSPASVASGF